MLGVADRPPETEKAGASKFLARLGQQPVITRKDIDQSIDEIAKSDPRNIQEVAASQTRLIAKYHQDVMLQAQASFTWALRISVVGFALFVVALAVVMQWKEVALISVVSGAILQVISGLNFYLYGKTSSQFAEFHSRLQEMQGLLVANSICESIGDSERDKVRSKLVESVINRRPVSAPVANATGQPTSN